METSLSLFLYITTTLLVVLEQEAGRYEFFMIFFSFTIVPLTFKYKVEALLIFLQRTQLLIYAGAGQPNASLLTQSAGVAADFGTDITEGVTRLVRDPYVGATRGGLYGFFCGLGSGGTEFVRRSVGGTLGLATGIVETGAAVPTHLARSIPT